MSGVFGLYWKKFVDLFCENLRGWREKKGLSNLANRALEYEMKQTSIPLPKTARPEKIVGLQYEEYAI